jgi:BMFP domain-containing protein YqiC
MTHTPEQFETQVETIHRYQRENDMLTKRVGVLEHKDEHAQAYIIKIKAQNASLMAQLTLEAKAEWAFK